MKAIKVPEISDAEVVFGTTKSLPAYATIPPEFLGFHAWTKWNKFVSDALFSGVKSVELTPKEGIDPKAAYRAIRAHLVSWAPKHEHKESGVAYLMSLWFDDVKWERVGKEDDK
jgi:hypothetical protein